MLAGVLPKERSLPSFLLAVEEVELAAKAAALAAAVGEFPLELDPSLVLVGHCFEVWPMSRAYSCP